MKGNLISNLKRAKVELAVSILGPHGNKTIGLDADNLGLLFRDPEACLAKQFGILKNEYLLWHAEEYKVRCRATTRKGRQCKCSALIAFDANSPPDWLRARKEGGYCAIHGGQSE